MGFPIAVDHTIPYKRASCYWLGGDQMNSSEWICRRRKIEGARRVETDLGDDHLVAERTHAGDGAKEFDGDAKRSEAGLTAEPSLSNSP